MTGYFAVRSDVLKQPDWFRRPDKRPRFAEGDQLALFHRYEGHVFFTATAVVTVHTSSGKAEDDAGQLLIQKNEFRAQRSLAVLCGSLRRVTSQFLRPEIHFRRRVVRLLPEDFYVIQHGELDMERSTFRYLFSPLPFALKADFVRRNLAPEAVSANGVVRDYGALARTLISYLKTHVAGPLDMMRQCSRMYSQLNEGHHFPRFGTMVLADEHGEHAFNIGELIARMAATSQNRILDLSTDVSLLSEAATQLGGETGDVDDGQVIDFAEEAINQAKWRKWKEKIF